MSDQANPAAGSADRLQQLKLNTGPCSSCQCGFCATLSGIRAGPASHMTDDGIADGDKGLVGTGTGTWSLDIGRLSLARAEDGNGECSDWCFRRLIPCTVAAGVTIGHNRERVRQRAEGRDHDSPQKDEDRSQGTQEPSLSLHLDRHVGQKTPACILTHRHRAGQSVAGSRDPEFRTQRIPPKTKGTQSKPQAARATQQIEADSPPIDSVDSAHMRTRLGSIQPMIPGCHTVYINHMGRTHARLPIARPMAFGGCLRCWAAGKRWGGQPLHTSAASFCKSAASRLGPGRGVVRYFVYFAVHHRDSLSCLF